MCIEILEIDVSKREDREARIDRPKYQWDAYSLVLHQKQDGAGKGVAAALPHDRPNRVKALQNQAYSVTRFFGAHCALWL
ncbi:hypothetical protein LHFGNBLO_002652 [Mesorhizobium sp. AR10]|uniref:hypothetical protein n=1 Tax=Mesorhizobium sp. AR10 TaxID=2865839 RepID=UPI00215E01EB|nr:hypothetical protein [Mesorhizobium sp. AR10]UVK41096.1 hypothetical protein LHFGNBLO_002652 [Mesorhizobium sp. AR10]